VQPGVAAKCRDGVRVARRHEETQRRPRTLSCWPGPVVPLTTENRPLTIHSGTVGDATRFLAFHELASGLVSVLPAPADHGRVRLIVRRSSGGSREVLDRVRLSVDSGVPGDAWNRRERGSVDAQISVIQFDVAVLIANGQPLPLFGDNLFLNLDLSAENLPPYSLVRVGGATLAVTSKAHNGCHKFRARFGPGAAQFVTAPQLRHRNLRGVYMRVVKDGEVVVGDGASVARRGPRGIGAGD